MPFTLTADERKAMSRRLVKIDLEIDFFNDATDNTASDIEVFEDTDSMNKALMDFYNEISSAYEDEKRALNGEVPTTFDESDVTDSAREVYGNIFYPRETLGVPNNPFLIPGVQDTDTPPDGVTNGTVAEVNGEASSNDSYYEENIVSNPATAGLDSGNGVAQIMDTLRVGFTPSASATTTLASTYVAGSGTMSVTSGTNIANGDRLLVTKTGGSLSALFTVKAGGGTATLTVYEIVSPTGDITVPVFPTPNDTSVVNTFTGFSNSERNTLTASSAINQNVLDGLTTTGANCLINKVLDWETKVTSEQTAIAANEEERATQSGELIAADSANVITLAAIDAWQALSNTGASGKFVDSSLTTFDGYVTARITTISTRISQIVAALGSVTDNSDGTVTYSDDLDIYPQRYKALNYRINRAIGSLKKKIGLEGNSDMLSGLTTLLESSKTDYAERMLATKLHSNGDGTSQIEVEDSTGFAVNDAIYLVSETGAELNGVVRYITGNNIVLSFTVSAAYTVRDLARLYKTL